MTRRRRRTLRFAMWACVACSVLCAGVWTLSGLWHFGWRHFWDPAYAVVEVDHGSFVAFWGSDWGLRKPLPWQGFSFFRNSPTGWRGGWVILTSAVARGVIAPLWFLALLFLPSTALCFYLSRRPIPGLCPRCHYDLSGVPAGICPECGPDAS